MYSLWVEEIPSRLGFNLICQKILGDDRYAPYFFVLLIVFIDVPVLSTISYIIHDGQTVHPLIDYPWWGLVPLALVIGIFGMRRMRSIYTRAIKNTGQITGKIKVSSPNRLRSIVFVVALILYFIIIIPDLPELLNAEGQIIGIIKWALIIPCIYVGLIVEFFVIYIHSLFFLPISITVQNIPLDFSDPTNLGGMGDVGDLIILSTIYYYLGLALWTGTTLIGPLTGIQGAVQSGPGIESIIFFILAWAVGGFLLLISLWVLHSHMYENKKNKLQEIKKRIQDSGTDDKFFPYTSPEENKEVIEYMQGYIDFRRIEDTKTYPIDIDKLWELFVSAALPILLQSISIII